MTIASAEAISSELYARPRFQGVIISQDWRRISRPLSAICSATRTMGFAGKGTTPQKVLGMNANLFDPALIASANRGRPAWEGRRKLLTIHPLQPDSVRSYSPFALAGREKQNGLGDVGSFAPTPQRNRGANPFNHGFTRNAQGRGALRHHRVVKFSFNRSRADGVDVDFPECGASSVARGCVRLATRRLWIRYRPQRMTPAPRN